MGIKAVIFDMGGTIETFSYTRQLRLSAMPGLRAILASAGILLDLNDEQLLDTISTGLSCYHEWRMQTLRELPAPEIWRNYLLGSQVADLPALDRVAEELMFYFDNRCYERVMRPEIPDVLQALQRLGYKIGLISNIPSRDLVPFKLKEYGIIQYFDPIIVSSVYGRRKPDPAIFHYAARMVNLPTSQCLYVGDRVARDIVGARRAGYGMAVQIQHNFQHGEDDQGASPDAVIFQMSELLDILQAEAGNSATEDPAAAQAPNQIRAFLFDAGDILYYRPERGSHLTAFLQELAGDNAISSADNYLAERQDLHDLAFQGRITQDQYREQILRLYGVTAPEQVARGKQAIEADDNDVKFFDGVAPTLAALKQKGYLLGIITDTANPVHVKLNWFERGGFGDVWDTIISSQEMGIRKPHPSIYQAALQQLGLQASQAVFVGHKASELEGARAVGMKTIAFNYDKDASADCYIESFSELLDIGAIA